jgi:hypothetical protein
MSSLTQKRFNCGVEELNKNTMEISCKLLDDDYQMVFRDNKYTSITLETASNNYNKSTLSSYFTGTLGRSSSLLIIESKFWGQSLSLIGATMNIHSLPSQLNFQQHPNTIILHHSIHSEQTNTHMDIVWFIGIALLTGILAYFEMEIPMQHHKVYDVGHNLVKCSTLPDWFFRGSFATTINSLLLCGSITYALMDVYMMGEITTLLTHLIVLFGLRFVVGSCTRLPLPYDFVPHTSDIPPKGCNFFFLFSAHTATITSVGLHVTGKHGAVWWWLFVPILVFQSIRLLSTRGHYTADILLALVLSIFLYI